MRFAKFKLPLWVAGGLLTATATSATAAEQTQLDPGLYTQVAQADVPAAPAPAPAIADVPQEDAYQMRALPPQEAAQEASEDEGPVRYLERPFLTERGISTYGWVNAGIGANNWGYPWNGPITFNDRSWQAQMNQLYLVNEKVLDLEDGGFDWGGRVDLLYGTDYIFTTARGLDGNLLYQPNAAGAGGAPSWGN